MNNYASNVVINDGEWLLLRLMNLMAVLRAFVKTICYYKYQAEHMDYFQTEANLKKCFLQYIIMFRRWSKCNMLMIHL